MSVKFFLVDMCTLFEGMVLDEGKESSEISGFVDWMPCLLRSR